MTEDAGGLSRRGLLHAAAATAAAAATGSAAAQEGANNTTDGNATGNETTTDGPPAGGETHDIDMNDQLVFDPDELTIAPGDTVVWTTSESQPHTVTAYEADIPADAAYFASGGFGSEEEARANAQAGYVETDESFQHTFDVTGTYEYFCIPHEAAGMVGTIEVAEGGGGGGDGGGGGGGGASVSDTAITLAIATVAGALATLGLAYGFLRYGGAPDSEAE